MPSKTLQSENGEHAGSIGVSGAKNAAGLNSKLHADNGLPSPAELPNSDIVVFDGHCVFCTAQVERLNRMDGADRLSFLSLHDSRMPELFPEVTHEMAMKEMYIRSNDGRLFAGASAVRFLTRRLPKLWILAPFLHIPFSRGIWQWLYLAVAKRRYRIAGKTERACEGDACEVHFGKERTK